MEEWQNPETITKWIVIVVIFFLVLLAFIIVLVRATFKKIIITKTAESKAKLEHQQNILKTTISAQEKERKRIAADLHDSLVGKLIIIKLQEEIKNKQDENLIHLIDECIDTARWISHDLSPPLLEFSSLLDLVKELLEPVKNRIKIESFYNIQDNISKNDSFKIQFVRIIQEVITNINKHAKASLVKVHYRQSKKYIIIIISDDGVGFNNKNIKRGLGLKNIETRVQYLQGHYRIVSKISKGTTSLFLFHNNKNSIT